MTLPRLYENATDAAVSAANGWRERTARAHDRIAAQKDPALYFKRIIRAKEANFAAAEGRARDEYAVLHATVVTPLPARIHPQVHEKLIAFLAENGLDGKDLTMPLIETGETLDAMIARYRDDAQAEHDRAMAGLAQMERDAAQAELEAAQARVAKVGETYSGVPAPVAVAPVEPIKRGPGRPVKRLPVGEDLSQILTADD